MEQLPQNHKLTSGQAEFLNEITLAPESPHLTHRASCADSVIIHLSCSLCPQAELFLYPQACQEACVRQGLHKPPE